MKRAIFLTIISLFFAKVAAQHYLIHPDIPVDSSYNVLNELKKHKKNYPFIKISEPENSSNIIVKKNIVYESYGNRDLHLDVFQPITKNKTPVIILIHGGGWRSGNKDMDHHMAEFFALNGYSAVCVEYRLSKEALYPAALRDVKTAIRWTRANAKRYKFDKNKIALMGCSSGGQMVSLLGSINDYFPYYQTNTYKKYSDKVQAVIDFDGVLAFIHPESSEGIDKPGKPSAATLWFGKTYTEKPELWAEASALTHVGKKSAPFLFINSAQPRFSAGQHDLMNILKSNDIYCEEHLIQDSPHSFWLFHPWIDLAMNHSINFLNKIFR